MFMSDDNFVVLSEKLQCQLAALQIRVALSRLSTIASTCTAAKVRINAIKNEIDGCLELCDTMDYEVRNFPATPQFSSN